MKLLCNHRGLAWPRPVPTARLVPTAHLSVTGPSPTTRRGDQALPHLALATLKGHTRHLGEDPLKVAFQSPQCPRQELGFILEPPALL